MRYFLKPVSSEGRGHRFESCRVRQKISTKSITYKNLKINNFQTNVDDIVLIETYINAHIYISTSSEEGFGIPFLDAILFGCSCICSDIQVYKEIMKKYSKYNQNIYLVNSKDNIINSFYKNLHFSILPRLQSFVFLLALNKN